MNGEAQLSLRLKEDRMEAYLSLRPGPEALSLKMVQEALKESGIARRINWQAVRDALYDLNQGGEVIKDRVVARGKPPVPALAEHLLFHPRIRELDPRFHLPPEFWAPGEGIQDLNFQTPAGEREDAIDYRQITAFFIVQRGQVLALRRPPRQGEFGESLTGDMVPYASLEIKQPKPGENTYELDGKIYAAVDGRFYYKETEFGISTLLELGGDVGYGTGHIRFPGDLRLKGGIRDRFSVWVGGDLSASATLDCWDIFCGGTLTASEGIIGRGNALLRVRQGLEAKFVENCNVDVLGNIRVSSGILNSRIYTNGSISTGDRGKLVGGDFVVKGSVNCFNLGNDVGIRTEVHLGIDFVVQRKLIHFREALAKLATEKQDLRERLDKVRSRKLELRYQEVSEEELDLNASIEELLVKNKPNPYTELIVRGVLHPGVLVTFGQAEMNIEKEERRVRIFVPPGQQILQLTRLG